MFHHVGHVIFSESHEIVSKTLCATCSPVRLHIKPGLQGTEALESWTLDWIWRFSTIVKHTWGNIVSVYIFILFILHLFIFVESC